MGIIKKFYEERKCRICNKAFYVAKKHNGYGRRHSEIKSRNARTCSRVCSKENTRILFWIQHKRRQEKRAKLRESRNNRKVYKGVSLNSYAFQK